MGLVVMGIDPGQTTGVSVWNDEGKGLVHYEQVEAKRSVRSEREACERIIVLVDQHEPGLVCMEDFILTGGKLHSSDRAGLSPVRITFGLMVWLFDVLEYGGTVAVVDRASSKGVLTNDRLKRKGLYVPGKVHANDATRVALMGYRRLKAGTLKEIKG